MLGLSLQETRVYQEAKADALILRQLTRRLGHEVTEPVKAEIAALPLEQLGEDLLDFAQTEDLLQWLRTHQPQR